MGAGEPVVKTQENLFKLRNHAQMMLNNIEDDGERARIDCFVLAIDEAERVMKMSDTLSELDDAYVEVDGSAVAEAFATAWSMIDNFELRRDSSWGSPTLKHGRFTVLIAGQPVTGNHAHIKRALLDYGTVEAIEAASKLRAPRVKVKAGSKTFKGDVHEVHEKVVELIEFWMMAQYAVDPKQLYGGTTLPDEAVSLCDQEPPLPSCPVCKGEIHSGKIDEPGTPFLRGMVQRSRRPWYAPWRTRPYCAVICPHCKEVIGYEEPGGGGFEPVRKGGPYR
jgi:hypothetical protein